MFNVAVLFARLGENEDTDKDEEVASGVEMYGALEVVQGLRRDFAGETAIPLLSPAPPPSTPSPPPPAPPPPPLRPPPRRTAFAIRRGCGSS